MQLLGIQEAIEILGPHAPPLASTPFAPDVARYKVAAVDQLEHASFADLQLLSDLLGRQELQSHAT